ncbi:ATP-binding protein [uncultured Xanthomonas sp.]|uniref:ATP-binding protein n=1 Tax=uncultured Xanthomonas sp. TaxID=152831 RepID=UPI0025DABB3F|nr:ATP-binding protein [uncultured Xanthomonas sp.]
MTENDRKQKILRPSAARLLESMRDIGYSFESALADIVDNSISAEASHIEITNDVHPESGPYIAVLDDGRGMLPEELTQAMQHGSRSPREFREAGDLGRFGLGMKTASFSQCRRLTVVSRKNGKLSARCWDLDLVIEEDEWVLNLLDEWEISRLPLVDRIGQKGTLILWEKLDRLDPFGDYPEQVYAALNQLFGVARPHLALTFHRFIAPEPGDGTTKVAMSINGGPIDAIDPFARLSTPRSDPHDVEIIRMQQGEITVQAFTLPHHQRLSAEQLRALELGSSLVETQGLYVYRAKRLISGGSWLGLARRAELTKLLRVRVDVPTALDTEWSVDVRKSRLRPPAAVRLRLRPIVERMTESAKRPYTYRGTRQATGSGLPMWSRITERCRVRYEINRGHPLVSAIDGQRGEPIDLEPLLLAIEASLPLDTIFSDVGSDPHGLGQGDLDDSGLERLLAAFVEAVAPNSDTLPAVLAEKILETYMFAGKSEARQVLQRLRRIEPV